MPRRTALSLAVLLAVASAGARAAGVPACDALFSAGVSDAGAGRVPGLDSVRAAILKAAQDLGAGQVSCDDVTRGGEKEALRCYHGNHVALLGQTVKAVPTEPAEGGGEPLMAADFGDGIARVITPEVQGVQIRKSGAEQRWAHLNKNPALSMLQTQRYFCRSVVEGNGAALVSPISNDGSSAPSVVPAIYTAPEDERRPRLYKI